MNTKKHTLIEKGPLNKKSKPNVAFLDIDQHSIEEVTMCCTHFLRLCTWFGVLCRNLIQFVVSEQHLIPKSFLTWYWNIFSKLWRAVTRDLVGH